LKIRVSFKGLLRYEPISEIVTPKEDAVDGENGISGKSPSYEVLIEPLDFQTPRFELFAFLIMFE